MKGKFTPGRGYLDDLERFYFSSSILAISLSRKVQFCPAPSPSPVASAAKQYQQHYANETVPPTRKRWNPIRRYTTPIRRKKPRFSFCRNIA